MKKFTDFVKKPTLFAVADLSAPTKINEQLIESIKSRAYKEGLDYVIYTPVAPHIVFECNTKISNKTENQILESNPRNKLFPTDRESEEYDLTSLETIKESLVESIRDLDALVFLNSVRKELELDEIKLEISTKPNILRETYIAGKIFNQGSTVICEDNQKAEILSRGTNFVQVISEDGLISTKFLEQISESSEMLTYDEFEDQLTSITYKTYKSENLSEEMISVLHEHYKSAIYISKNIATIQKIDLLLGNLEESQNILSLHKIITENNIPELFDLIEKQFIKESTPNATHVIYNNKTDTVHSEHGSKEAAYGHLIDKMHFDKNHTVINKDDIEKHKIQNAKIKKIFPNRYNESKDYNLANDIVDYPEYKKMKSGLLRNGMTKKKSSVISMPLVKESDIDAIVAGVSDSDIINEYELNDFIDSVSYLPLSDQLVLGKLTLSERASQGSINSKALRLATTTLRKKLALVPLKDLSKDDRVKLERIVASNPTTVNTIAMKLAPKIKKLELEKLIKKEENNG